MKNKNFAGIDYFRLPAALLVVAIHTAPLSCINELSDFLITYCLGRVAVPFFFMVTGYFVVAPYVKSGFRRKKPFYKYLIKNGVLYLAAVLLYLPLSWYAGHLDLSLGNFLKALLVDGTFYHLWYFPAVITGCLILVLLMRHLPHCVPFLVITAYIAGLAGDSYYGLIQDIPWLRDIYEAVFSVSSYTRNGLFFAPVFLFSGMLLCDTKYRCGKLFSRIGLSVSMLFLLLEGYITWIYKLQRHNSMYLFLIPVMYFLFLLLLNIKGSSPPFFRDSSMLLYLIHPAVIIVLRGAAKFLGLTHFLVENTLVHYGAVCMLSLGAIYIFLWFVKRREKLCMRKSGPGSK